MLRQRLSTAARALALSGSLALGAVAATPAPASAAPGPAQFCQEFLPELNGLLSFLVNAPVNLTQDACVSAIQTGNPTAAAAALCQTPEISEFLVDDANYGKCQQEVKAFLENFFD